MQQASYLEGGPLLWLWPLYLHVNKKSDDDDFVNEENICQNPHQERGIKLYVCSDTLSDKNL